MGKWTWQKKIIIIIRTLPVCHDQINTCSKLYRHELTLKYRGRGGGGGEGGGGVKMQTELNKICVTHKRAPTGGGGGGGADANRIEQDLRYTQRCTNQATPRTQSKNRDYFYLTKSLDNRNRCGR